MLKRSLEKLYFSQSALKVFRTCPIRFEKRYIEGLYWTILEDKEKQKSQEMGQKFHLLAERYFCGIPTGLEEVEGHDTLKQWIDGLCRFLPRNDEACYYPEYELRWKKDKIQLLAKYDLIQRNPEGFYTIFDWKTERRPIAKRRVEKSIQTLLYRFLLVEAGSEIFKEPISPDAVQMIYWQPIYPHKPVVIEYSEKQYLQDKAEIEGLVHKILNFDFASYDKNTTNIKTCHLCEYHKICHWKMITADKELQGYEEEDLWEEEDAFQEETVSLE